MGFVQIIEFKTRKMADVEELMQDWLARTEGVRSAHRSILTEDRDRPDVYTQVVEFPSYEAAMRNSELPDTTDFARRLSELCDAPPTFRNLDVRRVDEM